MRRLLVATDFSTRSDRALRRGVLLAREASAEVALLHVVDDDQPPKLAQSQERCAAELLHDLAATMRDVEGLRCETRVTLGDPSLAIAEAAEAVDLVVMGSHRRQALRDVFVGTTIERTIRRSRRPVIMANGAPAKPYRRVLIATDLAEGAAHIIDTARRLGVFDRAETTLVHGFDAPARNATQRAVMTADELKDVIAEAERSAEAELRALLSELGFSPDRRILKTIELSAADTIRDSARRHEAELIVLGTQRRSGLERFMLGSVAEAVLRSSAIDVLVVPPTTPV